jgi:hypothetical protein
MDVKVELMREVIGWMGEDVREKFKSIETRMDKWDVCMMILMEKFKNTCSSQ